MDQVGQTRKARSLWWWSRAMLTLGSAVVAGTLWWLAWGFVDSSMQGLRSLAPLVAVGSGLLLLPALVIAPARWLRVVVAVACAVLLAPGIPLAWSLVHPAVPGPGVRVLEWNAQGDPDGASTLENLVADTRPDIVIAIQVPGIASSAALSSRYPYVARTQDQTVFVLSRFAITSSSTRFGPGNQVVVAQLQLRSEVLTVIGAHPTRPLTPDGQAYGAIRDPQIAHLAQVITAADAKQSGPVIAAGDFNVTPREVEYGRLIDATGLIDAADWPAWSALGTWRPTTAAIPGLLPLDHVLHSPCLRPTTGRVIWNVRGSQHAPLLVTLDGTCVAH